MHCGFRLIFLYSLSVFKPVPSFPLSIPVDDTAGMASTANQNSAIFGENSRCHCHMDEAIQHVFAAFSISGAFSPVKYMKKWEITVNNESMSVVYDSICTRLEGFSEWVNTMS